MEAELITCGFEPGLLGMGACFFFLSLAQLCRPCCTGGDAAVVAAALCYSLTTVRIGYFAARLRPLQLALAKSSGLAALSLGESGSRYRLLLEICQRIHLPHCVLPMSRSSSVSLWCDTRGAFVRRLGCSHQRVNGAGRAAADVALGEVSEPHGVAGAVPHGRIRRGRCGVAVTGARLGVLPSFNVL